MPKVSNSIIKKEITFSLKDQLFNHKKVSYFAENIDLGYSLFNLQKEKTNFKKDRSGLNKNEFYLNKDKKFVFDKKSFTKDCVREFSQLELKQRITHIASCLNKYILKSGLQDYKDHVQIILNSLPKALDQDLQDDDFGDFIIAPLGEYIARYGLSKKYLKTSLAALYQITQRFSCEYPIRFFINNFEDETLEFLEKCSCDKNYHVRRLSSEGLRNKLPWAQKININYKDNRIINILNNLYNDQTMYVRRSVANHLHDISKIDIDLVLNLLHKYKSDKSLSSTNFDYIVKHSLRTSIKNGNKRALEFININFDPKLNVQTFCLQSKTIVINNDSNIVTSDDLNINTNQSLNFDFVFQSLEATKTQYNINYIIYFRNAHTYDKYLNNNQDLKSFSHKVFNLKKVVLGKGEVCKINKKHIIKPMTTRVLYFGQHFIEIKVNGKSCGIIGWDLRTK